MVEIYPMMMRKTIYEDVTLGLDLFCDNGKIVRIPANSERVGFRFWRGNGVVMETLVYNKPQEGEYENDRIHLLIHPEGEPVSGYMITILEAKMIIEILDEAIKKAEKMGIPEE